MEYKQNRNKMNILFKKHGDVPNKIVSKMYLKLKFFSRILDQKMSHVAKDLLQNFLYINGKNYCYYFLFLNNEIGNSNLFWIHTDTISVYGKSITFPLFRPLKTTL